MEQQTTTLFATAENAGGASKNAGGGADRKKRLLEHKRSFIFHYDEMNVVMELEDADAGRFLKSIIAHAVLETGLTVRGDIALSDVQLEELIKAANSNGILHVLFRQFLMHFRTDTERYRRRVKTAQENGRKGGAPLGNSNACRERTVERNTMTLVEEGENASMCCGASGVQMASDDLQMASDGVQMASDGVQMASGTSRSVGRKQLEDKTIMRCKSTGKRNSSNRESTQDNRKQPKQPVMAKERAEEKAKDRAEGRAEERAEALGKAPDGAKSGAALRKAVPTDKPSCDYHRLMEHFNSLFAGILPEVKALGDSRRRAVRARMAEYGEESIFEVLEKVRQSAFLTGGGRTGWRATFDWIFKPQNFAKILEGNYDRLRTEPSPTVGYIPAAEQERRRNEEVKQHIFEKAMAHIRGTAVTSSSEEDCRGLAASFITQISAS